MPEHGVNAFTLILTNTLTNNISALIEYDAFNIIHHYDNDIDDIKINVLHQRDKMECFTIFVSLIVQINRYFLAKCSLLQCGSFTYSMYYMLCCNVFDMQIFKFNR